MLTFARQIHLWAAAWIATHTWLELERLNPLNTCQGRRRAIKVRQAQAAKRAADFLPIIESIRAAGAISLQDIADGLN